MPSTKTIFLLEREPTVWLGDELQVFYERARSELRNGASAEQLAQSVRLTTADASWHLHRLRLAGVVQPRRQVAPAPVAPRRTQRVDPARIRTTRIAPARLRAAGGTSNSEIVDLRAVRTVRPERSLLQRLTWGLRRMLGGESGDRMISPPATSIKVLVSGPVGAGKTTFTRALSEADALGTEEISSVAIGKATTTVALDFGSLRVGDQSILLFGTPGQERFDYMWEILCEGAAGLILLVAGNQPQQLPLARQILEFVVSQTTLPCVIGVTHLDGGKSWDPADVAAYFEIAEQDSLGVDARDQRSASRLLLRLLDLIEQRGVLPSFPNPNAALPN